MAYQKRVVAGGSEKQNPREFKIKKEKDQEEEAFILFDSDVDYAVEKLSIDDLPDRFQEKRITWFVNFSVKDKSGNFVNGVWYSLLFPAPPANTRLVIFDGTNVAFYSGPLNDRRHNNRQFREIRLRTGDPGGGTVPGG